MRMFRATCPARPYGAPTFGLVLIVGLLLGCTTIGDTFDIDKVDELTPGVSTVAEAKRLLGNPSAESNYADGSKLLQWQYVTGTLIGGSGAHVAILFGRDGRMIRVTHKLRQ